LLFFEKLNGGKMKSFLTIITVIFVSTFIFGQSSQVKYHIKSGIIEYEISGASKGKEVVYFDNYGIKEAKYSNQEIDMMGIKQKTNQIIISDSEYIYTLDVDKKTGTKMKNPFLGSMPEDKNLEELGKEIMTNMGGKVIGSETLLGKTCEIWEVSQLSAKIWVWNTVPLKTEVNMMGMKIVSNATKFEPNANVPKEKFVVPDAYTITESSFPGAFEEN